MDVESHVTVARYLRALSGVTARLVSLLDPEQVMATVVAALVDDFDAALARIWLVDAETKTLHLRAAAGDAAPSTSAQSYDLATSDHPIVRVVRSGEPLVGAGVRERIDYESAWAAREGIVAGAAFPLKVGDELRGVLSLAMRQPLPDEIVDALLAFASIVAMSLRNVERLRREQMARAEAESCAADAAAQARRLALVQQTARGLAVITSVQELCERLVDAIHECMGRHVVGVYLRDGDELTLTACRAPDLPGVREARRLRVGAGIVG